MNDVKMRKNEKTENLKSNNVRKSKNYSTTSKVRINK